MAVVDLVSLTKRYGQLVAVDGVTLAIERGQVFGLLGPNGSGKTTTLACAMGLVRPTSGHATVLGESARALHRTAGRVGAVFDAPILLAGLTVAEQLAYAARLRGHGGGREAGEVLEIVGIPHLARRPVTELSLGQAKRLAVATALAGRPELLVLDEPLAGLDPPGVRQLLALLGRLSREGVTIVLSSHRLHEMEPVLTHAAFLLAGRIARAGALADLLGADRRLRLGVDDPDRGRRVLEALEGVSVGLDRDGRTLIVDGGPHSASWLNRALVGAGVAVSELSPTGGSLPELFDSLVDELEESQRPRGDTAGETAGDTGAETPGGTG